MMTLYKEWKTLLSQGFLRVYQTKQFWEVCQSAENMMGVKFDLDCNDFQPFSFYTWGIDFFVVNTDKVRIFIKITN
eukprot:snap_masked-scaffold_51-processed-gene-1.3-mRNA-1 protein AED:1.00 eAED:1.00 QI:0/-1/0/0/-1/1/1/0/75